MEGTVNEKRKFRSSKDIYELVKGQIARPDQEEVFTVNLSRASTLKALRFMGLGSECSAVIPIKHICRDALVDIASAVVLVHTHPSGAVNPSIEDNSVTEKLRDALDLFDIKLVDHLIIGGTEYYSFADHGKL